MSRMEQIGDAALYLGDCRELMSQLPADICITDPPYGEQTHKGARTRVGEHGGAENVASIDFASIDADFLEEFTREALSLCRRWVVMTCAWQHLAALEARGLPLIRFGVWTKPNSAPQFTGDRPATGWEAVGIFHRTDERLRWNGGGSRAVWNVPTTPGPHPTQKPIALLADFVEKFSDVGETIIDPFMGSATTGVAAIRRGRKFIGIEQDERYFELACERIAAVNGTNIGPLFGEA